MKVVIPTFEDRVSPRFDCARAFLVVSIEDGQPSERQELAAAGWAPHERINRLVELGADAVVCGGIDCWSAESLRSAGIVLYGWVNGTIDEALNALCQGKLNANALAATDGRCRRERRPESEDQRRKDERFSKGSDVESHRRRRRGGRGRYGGPGSAG
ncbi:MAG: NifB/NifX family molybdenum-iron cluster-binding protein [Planctomycetes bacterium]|nr:NifB/NifX family molybdenum-iron cluster-binding protein [Planctomycetota bacterium]